MLTKNKITEVPFESSNIKSAGYDPKDKVMQVTFKSKKKPPTYQYKPVSKALWDEYLAAESKGGWFNLNIRSNDDIQVEKIN